ncbi:M20/M25/M40 family metallo-hydrolase [Halosimplex sp. TS25]|uniref:M20/M25/M40 family metallo-hydrolase n=1 Tax=Halosimplex rarum TaxID=3396619 RepID=UPI0039E873B9
MEDFAAAYGDRVRAVAERLVRFETTAGDEAPAQEWVGDRLADLNFETYTWTADADALASHPSFAPARDLSTEDRPSVAGVLELGDPDAGRTLVLNGHVDVVPAGESGWTGDPFEPRWEGDRLIGRGAVDMKSQLAICVFAARYLADLVEAGEFDLDGRIVVESVAGEEDGGIGAATAARSNPYPFERDAAVVAEPTDMRVVTATEGCLMGRIGIEGTPAHAARRWEGESVLPAFERVRRAFVDLEAERADAVTHPLYDRFDVPWPIVIGRVEAGTWASNVPGTLTAEFRAGVAPGESLDSVEAACRDALDDLAAADDWTVDPPTLGRFGVQFESAEIDPDEPVVVALRESMAAAGLPRAEPVGETYGSDARHYIEAGIPTVVFGPGRIEEAHFPDESIRWPDVLTAGEVLVETARRFLSD